MLFRGRRVRPHGGGLRTRGSRHPPEPVQETILGTRPTALWSRTYDARVFFVVPHPRHRAITEPRVDRFVKPWAAHVKRVS